MDVVNGNIWFTDNSGTPINFKLVCDPVSKAHYRNLIEKHCGETLKCQRYPRLLLSTKKPCEHLHVGCEDHPPYTATPIFDVTWLDDCISASAFIDIKAYLFNPSPQFSEINYMHRVVSGYYQPPPLNPTAEPSRCNYLEIKPSLNGSIERHERDIQAICSQICGRSVTGAENQLVIGREPSPSLDSGNQECQDVFSDLNPLPRNLPSSTPRIKPPAAATKNSGVSTSRNPALQRFADLPVSLTIPDVASGSSLHTETPSLQSKKPNEVAPGTLTESSAARQSTSDEPGTSAFNRLSFTKIRQKTDTKTNQKPQANPRSRELINWVTSANGSSDEDIPSHSPPPVLQGSLPRGSNSSQPNTRPRPSSQSDSNDDFGPPPGSVVKVQGVRQNTRAPYTRDEEMAILKYIKAAKKFRGLRSNVIWREMEYKPGLERRSNQSLKEHFLKKMLWKLERYNIFTEREIKQMRSTEK